MSYKVFVWWSRTDYIAHKPADVVEQVEAWQAATAVDRVLENQPQRDMTPGVVLAFKL